MGIRLFGGKSCMLHERCDSEYKPNKIVKTILVEGDNPAAPNPLNFTIIHVTQVGKHIVVKINYPDCLNYEGNKICIYLNTKKKEFITRKEVDPHFSTTIDSPFARFKPTQEGWNAAISLLKTLN